MTRAVILISGRGSNMRAILAARLPITVAAVISSDPGAAGIAFARESGIEVDAADHRSFATRAAFDAWLDRAVDRHAPDLVILAGFMRVLASTFVLRHTGRMVNIHPSLLPAFPGLHTHRRALAAGVRLHGCTVHYVTPELDAGPAIIQAAVPVMPDDDEDTLAARVLAQEHRIYPQALAWIAQGLVRLSPEGRVSFPHGRPAEPLVAPALDA